MGDIPRKLYEGVVKEAIEKIDDIGSFIIAPKKSYMQDVDEIMITMIKNLYKDS